MGRLRSCELFRYEFEPTGFELRDKAAGYWVSAISQVPVGVQVVPNLDEAIEQADGRLLPQESLWPMIDRMVGSSLRFSIIRARNALPRDV